MKSWEDYLTDDEALALGDMRAEADVARQEVVDAKRKFDRICDEIYLMSRRIRDQIVDGERYE